MKFAPLFGPTTCAGEWCFFSATVVATGETVQVERLPNGLHYSYKMATKRGNKVPVVDQKFRPGELTNFVKIGEPTQNPSKYCKRK